MIYLPNAQTTANRLLIQAKSHRSNSYTNRWPVIFDTCYTALSSNTPFSRTAQNANRLQWWQALSLRPHSFSPQQDSKLFFSTIIVLTVPKIVPTALACACYHPVRNWTLPRLSPPRINTTIILRYAILCKDASPTLTCTISQRIRLERKYYQKCNIRSERKDVSVAQPDPIRAVIKTF